MLYNLIMTIVLTTGDYETNLIDMELSGKQCQERALALNKIIYEELKRDKDNAVDNKIYSVNVMCTEVSKVKRKEI